VAWKLIRSGHVLGWPTGRVAVVVVWGGTRAGVAFTGRAAVVVETGGTRAGVALSGRVAVVVE
jgi:hypothetical protein